MNVSKCAAPGDGSRQQPALPSKGKSARADIIRITSDVNKGQRFFLVELSIAGRPARMNASAEILADRTRLRIHILAETGYLWWLPGVEHSDFNYTPEFLWLEQLEKLLSAGVDG